MTSIAPRPLGLMAKEPRTCSVFRPDNRKSPETSFAEDNDSRHSQQSSGNLLFILIVIVFFRVFTTVECYESGGRSGTGRSLAERRND